MAKLVVQNLTNSVELDREAMAAIVGGAQIGARANVALQHVPNTSRVVQYPPGFPAAHQAIAGSLAGAQPRNFRRS
jgi:acyl CoA:acetate/3-ketoacid CoA transferase beta subunit